jgi:hypothetical protein
MQRTILHLGIGYVNTKIKIKGLPASEQWSFNVTCNRNDIRDGLVVMVVMDVEMVGWGDGKYRGT